MNPIVLRLYEVLFSELDGLTVTLWEYNFFKESVTIGAGFDWFVLAL